MKRGNLILVFGILIMLILFNLMIVVGQREKEEPTVYRFESGALVEVTGKLHPALGTGIPVPNAAAQWTQNGNILQSKINPNIRVDLSSGYSNSDVKPDISGKKETSENPGDSGKLTTNAGNVAATSDSLPPVINTESSPAGGSSGGSSSGGDSGGGGLSDRLNKAAEVAMQAAQMAQTILGPLKDVLAYNGKGTESNWNKRGNEIDISIVKQGQVILENRKEKGLPLGDALCNYEDKQFCENVTKKVCEDDANNSVGSLNCTKKTVEECKTRKVCFPINSSRINSEVSKIKTEAEKGREVRLEQNDLTKESKSSVDSNLNMKTSNTIVTIPGVAMISTPNEPPTTIIQNPEGESRIGITGAVISEADAGSQYVKFLRHDIDTGGEAIEILLFKPFNDVKAMGSNLRVIDGKTTIIFNKQKIYYPRQIRYTPYFMNNIVNLMDTSNSFEMNFGGEKGNYLADSKRIATVGDKVVSHPTINGLVIAKEREEMWERAGGII